MALVVIWIIAYWLTPSPAAPLVSTPGELQQAADRAEQADPTGPGPIVTVVPRSEQLPGTPRPETPPTETDIPPASPTEAPLASAQPAIIPPTFQIYTVESGDTMSAVAERFYGTPLYAGQIARANPTIDPIRLRSGTELKVPTDPRNIQGIPADPALQPGDPEPAFIEYVVTRGDTLSEIASSFYGRSSLWTHIRDANPQINRDATNIRPGMTIRIPPPPQR